MLYSCALWCSKRQAKRFCWLHSGCVRLRRCQDIRLYPTGGCIPPQLDGYSQSSIRDVISIFTNTIIDNPFEEVTLDCRHRSASNKLEVIPRKFQHWACRSGMRNLKSKQHQTNSVKFELNTLTITLDYRIQFSDSLGVIFHRRQIRGLCKRSNRNHS